MHLREGVTLLQLFFLEENLCSSTGFCRVHASPTDRKKLDSSVEPEFLSLGEIEKELESMSHNGIDGPLQEVKMRESCFIWVPLIFHIDLNSRIRSKVISIWFAFKIIISMTM